MNLISKYVLWVLFYSVCDGMVAYHRMEHDTVMQKLTYKMIIERHTSLLKQLTLPIFNAEIYYSYGYMAFMHKCAKWLFLF